MGSPGSCLSGDVESRVMQCLDDGGDHGIVRV